MNTISDSLKTACNKFKLKESEVGERTVQKVLRLYGYLNAKNQRYVCCISESPRIDIHTYSIADRNFMMCLITDNNRKVINSALWSISEKMLSYINYKNFHNCNSLDDIDSKLSMLGTAKMIMNY